MSLQPIDVLSVPGKHMPCRGKGFQQYLLVETPLGAVGLVWTNDGLCGVTLPGDHLDQRLTTRWPDAIPAQNPPAWIRTLTARLSSHLAGTSDSFRDVPCDLDGTSPFQREVLEAARTIPVGSTVTYGELAERIGRPGAARAVGRALGANPVPLVVPCHRIVAKGGNPGGFTAPGGLATKRQILAAEGYALV
jgi:O-6-methylguanine DNA methyltransferase